MMPSNASSIDVFWAAFGGGAAAGIVTLVAVLLAEYIRWRLAQPSLQIAVTLGMHFNAIPATFGHIQMFLEARNPSIHSVTVVAFGFALRDKHMMTIFPYAKLPYEIAGGQALREKAEIGEVLKTLTSNNKKPSDIRCVWFRAASGKEYRRKFPKSIINVLEKRQRENSAEFSSGG